MTTEQTVVFVLAQFSKLLVLQVTHLKLYGPTPLNTTSPPPYLTITGWNLLSTQSSMCISSQLSPYYKARRKRPLLHYVNHLGDDYPEQSIQQRPPVPSDSVTKHWSPPQSSTNITWDYESTHVCMQGVLTWLFALVWEHKKALAKHEKPLRGETFTLYNTVQKVGSWNNSLCLGVLL